MGRGPCRGQCEDVDKDGPLKAQKLPQAQGSPDGVAGLHGSRRKGFRKLGSSVFGSPLGSNVLPSAALLAELRRIFSEESARFALTLCIFNPGAWNCFFLT